MMETSTLQANFAEDNTSTISDNPGQERPGGVVGSFALPSYFPWLTAWYFIPIVLGLLCNLIAIITYVLNPLLHRGKPVNYLILNLVVSDFISCIVSMLYIILNNTQAGKGFAWKHKYACLALLAAARTPSQSSLLCLLMLSMERLTAIMYPLKHMKLVTGRSVKVAITLSWLFLCGKALVPFWWNNWTGESRCVGSVVYPDLFRVLLIHLPLYLSLSLTSLFNIIVGVYAFQRKRIMPLGKSIDESDRNQEPLALTEKRAEYKIIKMLLLVVGVYYLTWLPVKVMGTIVSHYYGGNPPEEVFIIFQSLRILKLMNLVLDPFIYVRMNTQFKKAYYHMCSWRFKQRETCHETAMSVMATSYVIAEDSNSK